MGSTEEDFLTLGNGLSSVCEKGRFWAFLSLAGVGRWHRRKGRSEVVREADGDKGQHVGGPCLSGLLEGVTKTSALRLGMRVLSREPIGKVGRTTGKERERR